MSERDPWAVIHDNGFSWDDVNALAAILDQHGFDVVPDVEDAADGVRYASGNGTSDYWRGFNDGINKLAEALLAAPTPTTAEVKG